MSVHYSEITPSEFRARRAKAPVAYLPLGTIEWHGEHLPLGSDGIQSQHFFEVLAEEVGGIVLPMLWLGTDREVKIGGETLYGMDYCRLDKSDEQYYETSKLDGSCYYVTEEVFLLIVESIALQLQRQGFKILVAHGHGPSTGVITKHSDILKSKFGIQLINCWGSKQDAEGMGIQVDHAAMNETSLVMAFRPDLVHMENLPENGWPTGIGGRDPRKYASEQLGKEIVSIQKERMVQLIKNALDEL